MLRVRMSPQERRACGASLAGLGILVGALMLSSCGASSSTALGRIAGSWNGSVIVEGRSLGIVVHFAAGETPTIDIPSQHAYGLPLSDVRFRPPKLSFDLHSGSDVATFHGEVEGIVISGGFSQGGHSGTFSLTRSTGSNTALTEVQHREVRVVLRTPTGDIVGRALMPDANGPFPVVLIVSGGGMMDHNGNLPERHIVDNSLLLLADALSRAGFASIRYDKRGVGESARALSSRAPLQFSDLINDAAAWVASLRKDSRYTKIGLIGYDEGSLVGMVAAQNAGVDAFVSLAGSAVPADVTLRGELATAPASVRGEADSIILSLKEGKRVPNVSADLRPLLGPSEQPFLMSKLQYSPLKEIARLTMPTLVIQGTDDEQLNARQAEALSKALPGSYFDLVTGMNHVLKRGSSDHEKNVATYSNPDLPLDPELVQVLNGFLKSTLAPVTAHE